MTSALSTRLRQLEKRAGLDDPLALLSDDELQQAIDAIDASIVSMVGIPIPDYARQLHIRLAAGDPPPDGLTQEDVQRFVAGIINDRQPREAVHAR